MVQGRTTGLYVEVTPEARSLLESWQRSTTIKAGLAKRARAVLLRYEGVSVSQISRTVGLRRRFVEKWIKRFNAEGLGGLDDRPGRGRKTFFPSRGGHSSGAVGL